jgi:hypothetical protein
VHRARGRCDRDRIYDELELLNVVFRQNGYSDRKIRRALYLTERVASPKDKLDSVACLSYFNHISTVLSPHNVKLYGLPPRKTSTFLRPFKDDLGVRTPRHTLSPLNAIRFTGISELEHPDGSAVTEQAISLEHRIQLRNISILFINPRYRDRIIKEATELQGTDWILSPSSGKTYSVGSNR